MFWATLIFCVCAVAFMMVGVGIRMFFIKGAEFRGSCSSNNPMLNKDGESCSLCGAKPGEQCANDDEKEFTALPSSKKK